MAQVAEVRLVYRRRVGFPGFSHIELCVKQTIILEEGDNADEVRHEAFNSMADEIQGQMAPIVEKYRQARKQPQASKPARKPKKDQKTPQEPVQSAQPGNVEGADPEKATLKADPRVFTIEDLDLAKRVLLDEGVISDGEQFGKAQIRAWLLMTPLQPGFPGELIAEMARMYLQYRSAGLKSKEALEELRKDWNKIVPSGDSATMEQERSIEPGPAPDNVSEVIAASKQRAREIGEAAAEEPDESK